MARYCVVWSITFTILVLFVLAIPTNAPAQSLAFGMPPFSSVTGGPESINLSNLSFVYPVQVYSRTGRGTFSVNETIQGPNWGQACLLSGGCPAWALDLPPANIGNPVGFVAWSGPVAKTCRDSAGDTVTYNVDTFSTFFDSNGNSHGSI